MRSGPCKVLVRDGVALSSPAVIERRKSPKAQAQANEIDKWLTESRMYVPATEDQLFSSTWPAIEEHFRLGALCGSWATNETKKVFTMMIPSQNGQYFTRVYPYVLLGIGCKCGDQNCPSVRFADKYWFLFMLTPSGQFAFPQSIN